MVGITYIYDDGVLWDTIPPVLIFFRKEMGNAQRYSGHPPQGLHDDSPDIREVLEILELRKARLANDTVKFLLGFALCLGEHGDGHGKSLGRCDDLYEAVR